MLLAHEYYRTDILLTRYRTVDIVCADIHLNSLVEHKCCGPVL